MAASAARRLSGTYRHTLWRRGGAIARCASGDSLFKKANTMLDARRLLDQFLGGQQGPQVGGQQDPQGDGQQGQLQFGDIARNIGSSLSGNLGGIGGGALAGGLAGILLGTKTGRKVAGTAATVGGMALVGALAYGAYRNWQSGRAPATDAHAGAPNARASVPLLPAPRDTPFNPASETEQQSLGLSLMRAMIAAAKSDGHIDTAEQANIFAQLDKLELSAEERAFVLDELRRPLDVDAIARAARTPEQAAEIYVASLLAIDVDNPAERGYLAMLAARLKLDDGLVAHLHATVESAAQQAVPVPS
jgi:uncharacterized membrane protein YebE (DUF533 family)